MRKNIAAVLEAFEQGKAKKQPSCSTDGATLYSYNTPIAWHDFSSDGTFHVADPDSGSWSATTKGQIRAARVQLAGRIRCTHTDCNSPEGIEGGAPHRVHEGSMKTWVEMSNGQILTDIPFVLWINNGPGRETRYEFKAPNPPCYHGDPNLFSRLSFESIKARLADMGYQVDHIIRGECSESGVRDCYVYNRTCKVPFAVIRPAIFVK